MLRWAGLLLLLFGLVLFSSSVLADVPHLINYQGYLLSSGGAPIAGPHNLTFQIYGDSLASDPVYWQELHVAVPVDAGLFHVVLGVTTPLADTVFVSAERWLGVTVDEDPEIAPRVRMTAVPWALKAAVADTALHSAPLPAHNHDDLYYREAELNAPGTINEPANPVDWTKLKSVPEGFADGVDNTGGGGGGWVDDGTVVRLETSTDKVGIGTSSPLYPLHVVNSSDSAYAYAVYGDASSAAATPYHDGVVGMNRSAATSQAGAGVFGFATSAAGGAAGVAGRASGLTGSGVSGVAAHTSGVNYGIYGQTLSSAGYAGYFLGGKNYFEGNVGIGTTTPAAKLDVAGTTRMTGFALSTGATNNYVLTSDGTGAGTWKAPQAAPDGDWIIAAPNMYSGVSGNVGIGTTTPHPNFRLHVVNPSAGAGCIGIYGLESSGSGENHSGVAGETMDSSSTIPWLDRGVYGLANATSGAASGVFGLTQTPGGAGVYGSANNTTGVNFGVYGFTGSPNGFAGYFTGGKSYFDGPVGIGTVSPSAKLTVENPNTSGVAISGNAAAGSGNAVAVMGNANSSTAYAAFFTGGRNYFGGDVGIGWSAPTTQLEVADDQSYRSVIYAHTNGTGAAAVTAEIQTSGVAVDAVCDSGTAAGSIAVRGRAQSDQYAGYFEGGKSYFDGNVGIGTMTPAYKLDVAGDANIAGTARVQVLEITGGDVAEKFLVREEAGPGTVVAIDPERSGGLCLARGEYNRRVAGVISGAGDLPAGAILGNLPGQEKGLPVALSGRVWVKCDASRRAIEPGDLLTTSGRPGLAMKVSDYARAQGAIIGKAMTALPEGEGLVLVLVGLQ